MTVVRCSRDRREKLRGVGSGCEMYRSRNIYVDAHIDAYARAPTHKHTHTHIHTHIFSFLLHFHEVCSYSIDTPRFSQIDLKMN